MQQPKLTVVPVDHAALFKKACQGLEKIASGRIHGVRDNPATAQIMRDIAKETLREVGYGDY